MTSWQVTGDTPDQYQFDGAGNAVLGHQIAFITGEGHRGSVFIPEDHYNPGYVRTQLARRAAVTDEVNTLSGSD